MSGGQSCTCKPQDRSKWGIVQYKSNNSYFNPGPKGSPAPSVYSSITCTSCGRWWRTKAKYVDKLSFAKL
jgi:hypothetical protein